MPHAVIEPGRLPLVAVGTALDVHEAARVVDAAGLRRPDVAGVVALVLGAALLLLGEREVHDVDPHVLRHRDAELVGAEERERGELRAGEVLVRVRRRVLVRQVHGLSSAGELEPLQVVAPAESPARAGSGTPRRSTSAATSSWSHSWSSLSLMLELAATPTRSFVFFVRLYRSYFANRARISALISYEPRAIRWLKDHPVAPARVPVELRRERVRLAQEVEAALHDRVLRVHAALEEGVEARAPSAPTGWP